MKNRTSPNRINGLSLLLGLMVCCTLIGCHTSNNAASNLSKSTQVIDVDDANPMVRKSASVYVGELLTVRLRAQSGTGYTWNIAGGASDLLPVNLVSRRVERDKNAASGAPVWEVFELNARKSGQTTVEFVYERPWERNVPAAKRVLLTVDVGY
jgi:predicted secreted protein